MQGELSASPVCIVVCGKRARLQQIDTGFSDRLWLDIFIDIRFFVSNDDLECWQHLVKVEAVLGYFGAPGRRRRTFTVAIDRGFEALWFRLGGYRDHFRFAVFYVDSESDGEANSEAEQHP